MAFIGQKNIGWTVTSTTWPNTQIWEKEYTGYTMPEKSLTEQFFDEVYNFCFWNGMIFNSSMITTGIVYTGFSYHTPNRHSQIYGMSGYQHIAPTNINHRIIGTWSSTNDDLT